MTSLRLRSGSMTRLMPARCAARNFSLMPPTGSTSPRSVISPVIATSLRIGLLVSSDAIAMNIVTPADGPSLGIAARRNVDVDVGLLEEVLLETQPLGARADERQRRLRRLLHDVAELAGQHQLPLAVHLGRLDEQDVAAHRRPREPGRHARLRRPLRDLRDVLRGPQQIGDAFVRDPLSRAAPCPPPPARPRRGMTLAISRSRLRTPASRV